MPDSRSMLVLTASLLVLSAAACNGEDDDPDASDTMGESLCMRTCDTVEPLACPGETNMCLDECLEIYNIVQCRAESRAYIACLSQRPASDFECEDGDGEAVPRSGVCPAEEGAVSSCLAGS